VNTNQQFEPVEAATETMRLLVVSREMGSLRSLWSMVESNSWHLETAPTGWEAMERVQSGVTPHLLILDLPRGDGDSLHVLRWLRRLRPQLPILLLCHASESEKKNDALRLGADDVLVRPFPDEQLEFVIDRYLRGSKDTRQAEVSSENIEPMGEDGFFVSASPVMRKLRAQAELLAQADVPVLILGEQGTGKETVARLVHRLSVRSGFKFLKVNCTAMPGDLLEKEIFGSETATVSAPNQAVPGKLESAGRGVILLDEITEMPNHLQAKLLGVLRDGRYARSGSERLVGSDVRILVSTTANIERALADNRLREDLYYRLSAFTVQVPPLRQRKEEIRVLLRHFMHNLAKHYGLPARDFSDSVIDACQRYSWPGNLKELETFVKRYIVAGESNVVLNELDSRQSASAERSGSSSYSTSLDLPSSGAEGTEASPRSLKSLPQSIKYETERNAIGLALEKTGWNRKAAARLLRVSYRTLLYKIDQYHMSASEPARFQGEQFSLQGTPDKGNGKAS
jgi:DNA-binding NtrC family response regulator